MGHSSRAPDTDTKRELHDGGRAVRCPVCGKEVLFEGNPFRPFCSRGCKGRDLVMWADEEYRIPSRPGEDMGDDERDERAGRP
ncbi:MAG TPA: DNA gyrase inhibitor YacG [Deltaproteobacteria bacterium]|nr:DNA gyrase inhibitor YacG [Deltaproteobacteria bacterium]